MKWENFEESKVELPEVIVESITSGFANATKQLLELQVTPNSAFERIDSKLSTRFQFRVRLISNKLTDYSLKVFEFGYNVDIFPVSVIIVPSILQELNTKGETLPKQILIESEEKLKSLLELIFSSDRFKEVVGGLMKLSTKNDIPF